MREPAERLDAYKLSMITYMLSTYHSSNAFAYLDLSAIIHLGLTLAKQSYSYTFQRKSGEEHLLPPNYLCYTSNCRQSLVYFSLV